MTLRASAQRRCCLVVGMHNSGTSLVGNLLDAAGLPLGDQLLLRTAIPEPLRPRYDYFEDREVVALQEETLLATQRHWSSYRGSFPLPAADHPNRQLFRERLKSLLQRRLSRARLWVVKDPRSAVLLDDWLQAMAAIRIQPALLIVHRAPEPTIASFCSKAGVPALWAEALWQRTYANALAAARRLEPEQVCLTSFESLQANPLGETTRICRSLGCPPVADLAAQVAARFDPSLPTACQPGLTTPAPLHPTSGRLLSQLQAGVLSEPEPGEAELLSKQIAEALTTSEGMLELNTLHPDGQTLQPKLSVWIVTTELQGWGPGGGIGSAYRELAAALADAGHAVHVLLVASSGKPPAEPIQRVGVRYLDPGGLSRLELCRQVAHVLREERPDVVHLHEWLGLGSGLRAALGADSPWLIVGLHGPSTWVRSGNPWPRTADGGLMVEEEALQAEGHIQELERDTLRQADLLVSPSRFMAQWVGEHLADAVAASELRVQLNCGLSRQPPAMAMLGRAQAPDQLVFFGRLEQRKGLLLFLEAIEQMPRPPRQVLFLGSDCRILGTGWASDLARERLSRLGVACSFQGTMLRDEALNLLQELGAVVVMPSLIENSPCAVEELLGSGLRLVVTDVGGSRELVSETSQGWLSSAEPVALARHLQAALGTDDPAAYRLEPRIPPWMIRLSWQAFHERLSRRAQSAPPPGAGQSMGRVRQWASAVGRRLRTQR